MSIAALAAKAKQASYRLATLDEQKKNRVLAAIATGLKDAQQNLLQANQQDMLAAQKTGVTPAMLDRLLLNETRLAGIIDDLYHVQRLHDPVGEIIEIHQLENSLTLSQRRIPLGVIGVIYEARPNVTIDIASLCLKTANACILRGGSETRHTNRALVEVIHKALEQNALSPDTVQLIDNPDRQLVMDLLKCDRYVDMIIPRGGPHLQQLCKNESTIPVIIGGFGICHGFVDASADINRTLEVVANAKLQRPSACNALDTLLVHQEIAQTFLPQLAQRLNPEGVELVADEASYALLQPTTKQLRLAQEDDFSTEWLSSTLGVKLVEGIDAALCHMRDHLAIHSDVIFTQQGKHAERFIAEAPSAAVYVNASTRFTDGAQFGLGAEVAVSTQKLHARGPMGLTALTSYKWVGTGDYLSRQ